MRTDHLMNGILRALILATLSGGLSAQGVPTATGLIDSVRPALPFPSSDNDGELPADGSSTAKWFVVWPRAEGERRIHVKANPLHPDTQAATAAAMGRIQEAVEAAERKAQAAYDRAVEEVRRTGKTTNVDGVTLEDEGVAGERIDAELELTIDLNTPTESFQIHSSVAPKIVKGSQGVSWIVTTDPNTYRDEERGTPRDRFHAAEARLLFGVTEPPTVTRRASAPRFDVTIPPSPGAFTVVVRGNETLLKQLLSQADWARLARATP
jgi:hypothetical protein